MTTIGAALHLWVCVSTSGFDCVPPTQPMDSPRAAESSCFCFSTSPPSQKKKTRISRCRHPPLLAHCTGEVADAAVRTGRRHPSSGRRGPTRRPVEPQGGRMAGYGKRRMTWIRHPPPPKPVGHHAGTTSILAWKSRCGASNQGQFGKKSQTRSQRPYGADQKNQSVRVGLRNKI